MRDTGFFIGLDANQKGYLFYSPASHQIYISVDITFDEGFTSTIATTWGLHRDTLALHPASSDIPTVTTTLEHTGDITNLLPAPVPTTIKEGEIEEIHATNEAADELPPLVHDNEADPDDDDDCPDLVPRLDDDSVSEADSDDDTDSDDEELDDDDLFDLEQHGVAVDEDISPQPANVSHYGRIRRPHPRHANRAHSYEWG